MVAFRSRRLEALLSTSLESIDASHIHALIEGRVSEETDLEFKSVHYVATDKGRYELGKDVAALANASGGIIVLGVVETQGRADSARPVDLSDAELTRIRQIVAEKVSPLPEFDILSLSDTTATTDDPVDAATQVTPIKEPSRTNPSEADPTSGAAAALQGVAQHLPEATTEGKARHAGKGFVIIAIPRSPRAPHAVRFDKEHTWRYPRRHGTTTRYLSTPEIATAYRDSFFASAHLGDRLDQVTAEASSRLERKKAWLLVTLVPDLPGDLVLTAAVAQQFQDENFDRQALLALSGIQFRRSGVGRRRLWSDGSLSSAQAESASQELHCDGAGAYAVVLYGVDTGERPPLGQEGPPPTQVAASTIALSVLTGLVRLAEHARDRTAAGGNASVRATLIPPHVVDQYGPVAIHRPSRPFGQRQSPTTNTTPAQAEALAPLEDLAALGRGTLATAALLTDELFQAFGIPEAGYFTRDGEVRASAWAADHLPQVPNWAAQHHLSITQSDTF